MLVLCAAVGLSAEATTSAFSDFTGRPIVILIEALREQGTRIVYRAGALPPRLLVTITPTSSDAFAALREILAPHGLNVELGPRETWLIVRQDPAQAKPRVDAIAPIARIGPPSIEKVIVAASRYPIERQSAVPANVIGRESIETAPVLGQDPLRVTHRLPGISSNQLTSRAHVRGGDLDEVLLILDGITLFEPYHLKDFHSLFSSIDPRIIETMDVRTGGYEARYGGKMSGVIDMKSIRPTEFRHHELAISLLDTSFLSDITDSHVGTPQYADLFNKIEFSPSTQTRMTISLLTIDDNITLNDEPEATASADHDDIYSWISLDRNTPAGLEAHYRLSRARLHRTRIAPTEANVRLEQRTRALHASVRYRPVPRIVTEIGMRWDDQSLTQEIQTSPRFNLLFDITARTSLRLA